MRTICSKSILRYLPVGLILWFSLALSQVSINSFQPFEPGGANYAARSGGPFQLGWPACGTCDPEPDVIDQFVFDEASGNIISEVNSTSVTALGTPLYSQSWPGMFRDISPCIDCTSGLFRKLGIDTDYDLNQLDYTIEFWVATATTNNAEIFDAEAGGKGYRVFLNTNGMTVFRINHYVYSESDATSIIGLWNLASNRLYDGSMHKSRIAVTRASNAVLWFEGKSEGTIDWSSMATKDIKAQHVTVCAQDNGSTTLDGDICELRISGNATNVSGGG